MLLRLAYVWLIYGLTIAYIYLILQLIFIPSFLDHPVSTIRLFFEWMTKPDHQQRHKQEGNFHEGDPAMPRFQRQKHDD